MSGNQSDTDFDQNSFTEDLLDEEFEVEEEFLKPRAQELDDELDITPMIDITFLLLIFFLVSSQMNAEEAVDLPKARHGTVVAGDDAVVIVMRRGSGEQAEVQKSDGGGFSANIEQQNAEIAEYVQQGFDAGKQRVIIRADGAVRHGEIDRVSEAISESMDEGDVINVAVMEQT